MSKKNKKLMCAVYLSVDGTRLSFFGSLQYQVIVFPLFSDTENIVISFILITCYTGKIFLIFRFVLHGCCRCKLIMLLTVEQGRSRFHFIDI